MKEREAEGAQHRADVLIAAEDPLLTQLKRLLEAEGFRVHTARAGDETVWLARTLEPDAILLGHHLPDISGSDLCRGLRNDPRLGPGTPVLIALPPNAEATIRREALRAHAWDVVTQPIDADELLHKLETYVQAKRHTDRAWAEGLLDATTLLYNAQGLSRRARELTAMAYRQRAPLACLALAPQLKDESPSPDAVAKVTSHVARVLRLASRQSDIAGRLGPATFALVAPDTTAAGAVGCAERLAAAIAAAPAAQTVSPLPGYQMCVGYEAVADVQKEKIGANELLQRAAVALRWAETAPRGGPIRRFRDQPAGGTR